MEKMELTEYRRTILQVLLKIDQVCREHHLSYLLYVGTLLGAVRHGGFIPWDDDIDIAMPREDYEALARILRTEDHGIRFLRYDENKDAIWPYGKICDPDTVLREENFLPVEGYGAFVDVFPMDSGSDKAWKRKWFARRHQLLLRLIQYTARTDYSRSGSALHDFVRWGAFHLGRHLDRMALIRRLDEGARCGGEADSAYFWVQGNIAVPKSAVLPVRDITFEGHTLLGPNDPDTLLRRKFGEDYMTPPPPEKQVPKHSLFCYRK